MARRAARIDGDPPDPLSFRTEYYLAGTVFPPRRPVWGELNYALSGVIEFNIQGVRYLSPPHYAIWIPPDTLHEAWSQHDVEYVSVYVRRDHCADLPTVPATLGLSALLKAILADLAARDVMVAQTPADRRLAQVLLDQISQAPRYESYLPLSDDALLRPLLDALQATPGDRRSLAEWARVLGTTERTLSRRCHTALGLSFTEWRQRLSLVAALALLDSGTPVQVVARQLGYANASAFTAMFRRLTGASPTQMIRTPGAARSL
jgi:AraC-like DNA-binding protein